MKNETVDYVAPIIFDSHKTNSNLQLFDISLLSLNQTYINSRECPFCGSHQILCHGNYKGRKRYKCKNCGKTYNDLTRTPFSGIHNLDKITKYISCIINGNSIRKAAGIVDVSVSTSFNWRHKLLNGIRKLPSPKMKNVREIMEIEIPYSHKGQRTVPTQVQVNSKLSALFICDRVGKLDSDSIDLAKSNENPLFSRITKTANNHTDLICSTKFKNINVISNVKTKISNSYYTQTNLISKIVIIWNNWMKRFRGVASKYLSNYLHWFDYLENTIDNPDQSLCFIKLLLKQT